MPLTPFRIEVPDTDLEDLRDRLHRTRWPEQETVGDWSQGVPLGYIQELCRYWADDYDWRAAESKLNALPQFRTDLDGLGIHFIHVRSPHDGALPLVMSHGWPGSVMEFRKVIGPLTDPPAHGGDAADAFHVVCPSLPGYGFSDKPAEPGWGIERIARAWAELMDRLGYERYGAQGSDWGTSITTSLGQQDREHLAGGHLENVLSRDDLLDNVMLYWLPGTAASSARLYWESFRQVSDWFTQAVADSVAAPAGCTVFPKENPRPSRRWAARRYTNIRYWSEPDRGGHFAAFEQPRLFIEEVRSFFRLVR